MLYFIFGFFGASVGAALGFVTGLLWPQLFYPFYNAMPQEDTTLTLLFMGSWFRGLLIGAVFGGGFGLFIARKINRKK